MCSVRSYRSKAETHRSGLEKWLENHLCGHGRWWEGDSPEETAVIEIKQTEGCSTGAPHSGWEKQHCARNSDTSLSNGVLKIQVSKWATMIVGRGYCLWLKAQISMDPVLAGCASPPADANQGSQGWTKKSSWLWWGLRVRRKQIDNALN